MRRFVGVVGVLVASAVAGLGACASLGRSVFQEPVIAFKDLRVNGIGVTGGNIDVVLSVYNPNKFKLEGTRLTYRLMVDSTPVGTGALDTRFTVQDRDSTIIPLPVAFTYSGLGAAGRQLLQSGSVNYRVIGDITISTPLGNFTRPYDRTGRFSTLGGGRR